MLNFLNVYSVWRSHRNKQRHLDGGKPSRNMEFPYRKHYGGPIDALLFPDFNKKLQGNEVLPLVDSFKGFCFL